MKEYLIAKEAIWVTASISALAVTVRKILINIKNTQNLENSHTSMSGKSSYLNYFLDCGLQQQSSNGESNRRKIVQLKEKAKLNKCVNQKPTMNSSRSRTQSDLADILKVSQGTLPQKTHF